MKVYRAYVDHNERVVVSSNEAKVTAKQVTLAKSEQAWEWRIRLPRDVQLARSERAALKQFIEMRVRSARLLQAQIREQQAQLLAARKMLEEL